MRREAGERERRGLFPCEMRRLGREVGCRHRDFFRQRASAWKAEYRKGLALRRTRLKAQFETDPLQALHQDLFLMDCA